MRLQLRNRIWKPGDVPLIMGILNVTPDSFSDGGCFSSRDRALEHVCRMIEHGADLIDIGPESTRPGASPVPDEVQIDRAVPVIEAVRRVNDEVPISIDTRLACVAEAALAAGADLINDVSALRHDPAMVAVAVARRVPVVLMHMRGTPETMQVGGGPHYDDVIGDVMAFLGERNRFAVDHGVAPERIILDPGLGFGKRAEHNFRILQRLDRIVALGQPVLIGASRKSFLGRASRSESPDRRVGGSIACAVLAAEAGAALIRVHDVPETVEAIRLWASVRSSG